MAIAVLLGAVIGLTIGCVIGATILRAAVHGYNKLVARKDNSAAAGMRGSPPVPGQAIPRQSAPPASSQNPYAAPSANMAGVQPPQDLPTASGIRIPSFAHAVGIVFVRSLVNGIINYGTTYLVVANAANQGQRVPLDNLTGMWTTFPLVSIAQLFVSFFVGTLFLTLMLPTKMQKAAIVQGIEYAIYLVILLMIGGIVYIYTGGTMRL